MKLVLTDKRPEAENIKSFFFVPGKEVNFLPGQYFYITLPQLKYPDSRGHTRHFTISSSPTEKGVLQITTQIREESGFKLSLADLKPGSILEGEGPNGTFIVDEHEKGPHVFLAGGIGITPFRSIFKYHLDNDTDESLHLIHSVSGLKQAIFKHEFDKWSESDNLKFDLTVTKPEMTDKWDGLTGRINEKLLNKIISESGISSSNFWLCGSAEFVDSMEELLENMKIPSEKVTSEKFPGY